jgi:hypothetical protein
MEPPPSGKTRIDRPATAARDVPAYLALGGCGDGPGWQRKGAQIWLAFAEGEVVHYLSGARPLVPEEIRVGGTIHRKDLDALLNVEPDTGRVTTPSIEEQLVALNPRDRARAMIEARILILVDEAMATRRFGGLSSDDWQPRRGLMRPKQELDSTESSTVYRRRFKQLRASCNFCRWHQHENAPRKAKRGTRKLNKTRRGR